MNITSWKCSLFSWNNCSQFSYEFINILRIFTKILGEILVEGIPIVLYKIHTFLQKVKQKDELIPPNNFDHCYYCLIPTLQTLIVFFRLAILRFRCKKSEATSSEISIQWRGVQSLQGGLPLNIKGPIIEEPIDSDPNGRPFGSKSIGAW